MTATGIDGEIDLAAVAVLFADRSRARILSALTDGRALSASVLADECGIAASTASEHLAKLVAGGLLRVEQSGRRRYYRLAHDRVVTAIESMSALGPQLPVRSLRASTRAAALRRARTCYDHLAGALGVSVTAALVDAGALVRTDGCQGTERAPGDPLASYLAAVPYRLAPGAQEVFGRIGVDLTQALRTTGRPPLRFCVDWSEQRHHLAGALGSAVLGRFLESGWVERGRVARSLDVTPAGRSALAARLGLTVP